MEALKLTNAFIIMNKKLFLASAIPAVLLGIVLNAGAHGGINDGHNSSAKYLAAAFIAKDQTLLAAQLGVASPSVLPGSPFYFVKNFARGVQTTLAFSDEAKAELKLRFSNEKIVETQILLDRGDKKRAAENLRSYEKDLAAAKEFAGKAKDGKSKLTEKFITEAFKHQAVIDKAEKDMSGEEANAIKELRKKTIGHIAGAVAGAESADKAKEALISAMSDTGSPFKPLRNLEVLKAIEEKVPEHAKAGIQLAQENAVQRFKSDYGKSTEEEKEALTEYIKSAGGDASRYIEAFSKNKEALGEELSQKLLSAGEEKKAVTETKPLSSSSLQSAELECSPPVSPKPNAQQHEYGTMTITPEVSQASEDNTITISLNTHINALAIQLSSLPSGSWLTEVIDWGPKQSELNEGKGINITKTGLLLWDTYEYPDANKQLQKRPHLRAQKYWIKVKAPRKTVRDRSDHDGEFGSYGWKAVDYKIAYVVGDTATDKDIKYVSGKDFFYIGGPQFPVGEIVRAGANTKSPGVTPGDSIVTIKAGEPFEIEAKPTGWQGGIMVLHRFPYSDTRSGRGFRIIGSDAVTVKAGESAIWKVLPTGSFGRIAGYVSFTNDCDRRLNRDTTSTKAGLDRMMQSFDLGMKFDFKGLTKEKSEISFHGAVAYVLGFEKPDSSFDITPALSLIDIVGNRKSYVANVPDFALQLQAVYKDNPQEIVKSVLITPQGKAQQAGSATALTNKDGETIFKVMAPNAARQEITRGILLKATAPAIPGLTAAETKLLFTNISIEVTPTPVVEKKPEPTPQPTVEQKPYEGSPPLLY